MSVMIDRPVWPARGRRWSHLCSDRDVAELHEFAARLGVPERGFHRDHYDLPEQRYADAVALGAEPVSSRDLVRRLTAAGLRRPKHRPRALRPNRSMPEQAVIPVLGYPDVGAATDWLCRFFGFSERWRVGTHRAQLAVGGGSAVALVHDPDAPRPNGVDHVMIRVVDLDAHRRRAGAGGADVVAEPTTYPYGERQYSVRDLSGRAWVFTESVADVDPAQWGASAQGTHRADDTAPT